MPLLVALLPDGILKVCYTSWPSETTSRVTNVPRPAIEESHDTIARYLVMQLAIENGVGCQTSLLLLNLAP
jgi:hypothetical protein